MTDTGKHDIAYLGPNTCGIPKKEFSAVKPSTLQRKLYLLASRALRMVGKYRSRQRIAFRLSQRVQGCGG